jgi:hypothetical protein
MIKFKKTVLLRKQLHVATKEAPLPWLPRSCNLCTSGQYYIGNYFDDGGGKLSKSAKSSSEPLSTEVAKSPTLPDPDPITAPVALVGSRAAGGLVLLSFMTIGLCVAALSKRLSVPLRGCTAD